MEQNMVLWFEIPVLNLDRAVTFYERVFDIQLSSATLQYPVGMVEMAWFPMAEGKVGAGGALVLHPEWSQPSGDGTLVYLNSMANDIDVEFSRVEKAGGSIITPKTFVNEAIGYIGLFKDTEGNKVAILSRK